MLEKMNRRSLQFQKKDELFDESIQQLEDPTKRKTITIKSRFSRSPKNERSDFSEKPLIGEISIISNNLMNISSLDFLTNDEQKFSGDLEPKNLEEKIEKPYENLQLKIPKSDESIFKYFENSVTDNRIRSRSGIENKTKSNLAGKLVEIKLTKTIKDIKYPNLSEIKQNDEFISSPTLNMGSPTIKKHSVCKELVANQQQLKNQIKFLNNAVLTFTLITEFLQKLTDENKIPQNIRFWFNEQKSNLEFLIGKLSVSEFSEEYIKNGDDIKKFNENMMEVAQVLHNLFSLKLFCYFFT